jgi:CheY-like chemotaxis protein
MATILVVDDRPSNREYLLALLGFARHRTPPCAANGPTW